MRHSHFGRALLALAIAGAGPALAQAPSVSVTPDNLIMARQAGMTLAGGVVGAMKPVAQAKGDPSGFKDVTGGFVEWGKAIPGMFPAGTEKGENTRALPAIWSDQAGFQKAAQRLVSAAESLQQAASKGDGPGFASAFQSMGEACNGCHRTYRSRQ